MTRKLVIRVAILVLASLIPYARGLENPWLWDDQTILGERLTPEHCQGLGDIWRQPYWGDVGAKDTYRPLSLSVIYLERLAFGENVVLYHVVSQLLHLAVCLLVMVVVGQLAGANVGWVSALLFAAHPVHAEAVAMVYGQLELISAIFMLLAIGFYIHSRRDGIRPASFAVAVSCGIGASFSKESGLMLPAVLMLVRATWMVGDGDLRSRTRLFLRAIGWDGMFVLGAIPYLVLRYQALELLAPDAEATVTNGFGPGRRIKTMIVSLGHALRLVTVPSGQTLYYGHLRDSVFGTPFNEIIWIAVAVAISIWLAVKIGRKRTIFGLGLFMLTFLPVSNILPTGVLVAERTLYLPSLGACVLFTTLLERLERGGRLPRSVVGGVLAVVLVGYSAMTLKVVNSWCDEETLWRTTIGFYPRSPIAQLSVGRAMVDRWQISDAPTSNKEFAEADSCFATAYSLNPKLTDALVGRGFIAERRGNRTLAEQYYRRAVSQAPNDTLAHAALRSLLSGRSTP